MVRAPGDGGGQTSERAGSRCGNLRPVNAPVGEEIRAFRAALRPLMVSSGWRKRSGDIFTFEHGEWLGWAAFGRSVKYRPLGIWANVGVRLQPLELLVADLARRPRHAYVPPTVMLNVGYLTPDHRWFEQEVSSPGQAPAAAAAVHAIVEEVGRPWIDKLSSLDAITAAVTAKAGGEQADYRVPFSWRCRVSTTRPRLGSSGRWPTERSEMTPRRKSSDGLPRRPGPGSS